MNRAITDTNIILNLAISPSLWLLSNNMVILKKPVAGYNNRLKIACISMKFGYNPINYYGIHKEPIKPLDDHNSNLTIIFGGSLLAAYIDSEYVL